MSEHTTTEVVRDAACWQRRRLGEPRGVDPESFDRWLDKVRAEAFGQGVRSAIDAVNKTGSRAPLVKAYLRKAVQWAPVPTGPEGEEQ